MTLPFALADFVTEPLLVAMLAPAFAALVLIHLCLAALLERTHADILPAASSRSIDDFVKGVFDNSLRAQFLKLRDQITDLTLIENGFYSKPLAIGQRGNRWFSERG